MVPFPFSVISVSKIAEHISNQGWNDGYDQPVFTITTITSYSVSFCGRFFASAFFVEDEMINK